MNKYLSPPSVRRGFTLIELLVVIAIIAILAVVVVLTLNPAELLRQSRDANRVSDMATLNSALNLYSTDQGGASSFSLGSSSVVYVSMADTTSTCANLGLPALPTGYTYGCSTSGNYHNASSSGWIPVNFTLISSGAPFGSLPVDPVNQTSSGLYYTYSTSGSQTELTAAFESQKYAGMASKDGGSNPAFYETGSALSLAAFVRGDALSGYSNFNNWTLSGGATVDASGVLHFTAYGQSATSPYIPIGPNSWTASAQFFDTATSTSFSPNGGMDWSSAYFSTSLQPASNTAGYSINGNAQSVSLNSWQTKTWGYFSGPAITYIQIIIYSAVPYTPAAFNVQNFTLTGNP